jgi:hypothetical protein
VATVDGTSGGSPHVGRAVERATVDAILADAKRGQGGSLVLTGQAGIGKSALVHYAIDVASESRVVRIAGVESEMVFGYASVHQAVLPILDHLGELPAPQRAALDAALGRVQPDAPDPFLVGLAVLSLRRRSRSRRAAPRRHRRRPVAGRRVGDGAVVRRAPAPRRTRRNARRHA